MAEVLRGQTYACVLHESKRGSLFILKLPTPELEPLTGQTPLRISHEIYSKRTAPVIGVGLRWWERPGCERRLTSFTDIADPNQRAAYERLSHQTTFEVLGYNELLQPLVRRRVLNNDQRRVAQILAIAQKLLWTIPDGAYDFELAKASVLRGMSLGEP